MAEYFAGGHLRFINGEWRNDDGDIVEISRVRNGHWSEADDDGEHTCSHCGWVGRITCLGKDKIWSGDIDYCPNCGAKMDEV